MGQRCTTFPWGLIFVGTVLLACCCACSKETAASKEQAIERPFYLKGVHGEMTVRDGELLLGLPGSVQVYSDLKSLCQYAPTKTYRISDYPAAAGQINFDCVFPCSTWNSIAAAVKPGDDVLVEFDQSEYRLCGCDSQGPDWAVLLDTDPPECLVKRAGVTQKTPLPQLVDPASRLPRCFSFFTVPPGEPTDEASILQRDPLLESYMYLQGDSTLIYNYPRDLLLRVRGQEVDRLLLADWMAGKLGCDPTESVVHEGCIAVSDGYVYVGIDKEEYSAMKNAYAAPTYWEVQVLRFRLQNWSEAEIEDVATVRGLGYFCDTAVFDDHLLLLTPYLAKLQIIPLHAAVSNALPTDTGPD